MNRSLGVFEYSMMASYLIFVGLYLVGQVELSSIKAELGQYKQALSQVQHLKSGEIFQTISKIERNAQAPKDSLVLSIYSDKGEFKYYIVVEPDLKVRKADIQELELPVEMKSIIAEKPNRE